MIFSSTDRVGAHNVVTGFNPVEWATLTELKNIVTKDHSPAVFAENTRKGANVISCDCIVLDVDNTPENPEISIEQFRIFFPYVEYYIYTSRNHMKEKKSGDKMCPPAHRYHVIFPLNDKLNSIEYTEMARRICDKHDFFDKACVDASRLYFGNPDTKIFYNQGKRLETEHIEPFKPSHETKKISKSYDKSDKNELILAGLQMAKSAGAFDNYADWLRLGMSLKADGFTSNDWIALSDGRDTTNRDIDYKWAGFDDAKAGAVTGASLIQCIRDKVDPLFMVPGSVSKIQSKTDNDGFKSVKIAESITSKPSSLDTVPSIQQVVNIQSKIIYDDSKGKKQLIPHWHMEVLNHDKELENSIHYDYTKGVPQFNYSDNSMIEFAIKKRLSSYINWNIKQVSKVMVDDVKNEIIYRNSNHNFVLDTIADLKIKWQHEPFQNTSWILDTFCSRLKYKTQTGSKFSTEQLSKFYTEIWHLYFLRMHMHIEGTRLVGNDYKFLIENDIVPILQGPQNIGKTTLSRWIGLAHIDEELYTDIGSGGKSHQFGGMDTAKMCRGKMIGEIGEMKIMKKGDVETIKSFISKKKYDIDIKFKEFTRGIPVTISFIGTSNDFEFLADNTGNRRWYPVYLSDIDKNWISKNIDFIEKLHVHYAKLVEKIPTNKWFTSLTPSDELNAFLDELRDQAIIRTPGESVITKVISKAYQDEIDQRNTGSHKLYDYDIIDLLIKGGYDYKPMKRDIEASLKSLGYNRIQKMRSGIRLYLWEKPINSVDIELYTDLY